MPSRATEARAKRDLKEGKRPSTAAGEFVREEIEHVRSGKHGARSTRQAIAIGLSKARRAGVPLAPPKKGRAKTSTRRAAERDVEAGQGTRKPRASSPRPSSARRSRASKQALKREGRGAASKSALSAHSKRAAAARRQGRASSQPAAH